MKAEFTAIIETAPEGGFWAISPVVPDANGQGETVNEAKDNLRQADERNSERIPFSFAEGSFSFAEGARSLLRG